MSALVNHPTPRTLAAHLATARTDLPSCIVPLRVQSSNPALFLVHPVGGNAGCYVDLAAAIGDDIPVYGIQNPALIGGAVEPRTIEDMCAEYARAIRTVQPRGPYFVGGWSVGGNFAIEVARSLAESGGEVGPLVLLDSWSPNLLGDKRPNPDDGFITWLFIKNNLGRAAGIDIPITPADTTPLSPEDRMALVRTWAVRLGTLPDDVPLLYLRRLVDVFGQTLHAHLAYYPKPYLGGGVHIQASTPAKGHPRPPTLGWEGVLPNVRTIVVPDTTHFVFIYPPIVHRLVAIVREAVLAR
jgi:thioesterase domain-containing protein